MTEDETPPREPLTIALRLPADMAAERLISLLREENTALLDMDFGRAGSLLQAKHAAAGALEAAFRSRHAELSPDTTAVLNALARENRALLRRAERIQKRVLALISRVTDRSAVSADPTTNGTIVTSVTGSGQA